MTKTILALAFLAASGLSAAAADDHANANGVKNKPTSSTAATPADKEHSPGTVGAMNEAGGGSFTATKKDEKNVHLKGN